MKKQLTTRLQDLKIEYQKGQERLTNLEQETANVKASMLRISGAIQVLEELMDGNVPKGNKEEIIENGVKK